ncbi:DNA-binding transcriptional MocR family regulator [Lysinibacter cavernae]|uniref:DNA-binding transcriptional MocR family regulator n=1 Tax=Lysinibacter cavernae TaxID=1640652 RepID=A0A7X5TUJ6_9MICO|nr:DNA-binding transcriptional MocR family regulator [Lysinibacter cavernae]
MKTETNLGTSLDPWYDHYAARAAGLSASEVRALFAVASRPEVVSLAGGMPFVAGLPNDRITGSIERVMATVGPQALQYGSGQGIPSLREHITQVMAAEGIQASPEDVVVTTGSQQALDLVTKIFIDPGDVILAEAPSYVGAIGVFRSYQAEISHVAMDDNGLIPEALEERIITLRAEGKTVKMLYTIPNFHNPAGVTLSSDRRASIAEICRRHHVLIMEDNPYGMLSFDEPAPDAIRAIDDGVVYLGSFSKTLAPGFRIGWVLAPHAIREKLILAVESAILCPSSFSQFVINDYLDTTDWLAQINTFKGIYRGRKNAMLTALDDHLPELSWTNPNGGFFVWLTLPDELHSKAMLPRAVKELVAYTPGTAFFADGGGGQNIRLSFCYPNETDIATGIRRLSTVINGELDLINTFGRGATTSVSRETDYTAPPPNIN